MMANHLIGPETAQAFVGGADVGDDQALIGFPVDIAGVLGELAVERLAGMQGLGALLDQRLQRAGAFLQALEG